jgi:predicted component of type VI protein secretion system
MLVSILTLLAAAATAPVPAAAAPTAVVALADMTEPDPKKMSQAEIRAHNSKLPRDHPYYIRCVKREDIGSLVKRNFSCRTNRQWAAAEDSANAEARAIADEMASKAWRTSN